MRNKLYIYIYNGPLLCSFNGPIKGLKSHVSGGVK